jgi:hypothetical protein
MESAIDLPHIGDGGRYAKPYRSSVRWPSQETTIGYFQTEVQADRRRLTELESCFIQEIRLALAGITRVYAECVALLGIEFLACSLGCEVYWDGH